MVFTPQMADRLYMRLNEIYKERFTYTGLRLSLLKTMYQSAFSDLAAEEIRHGLSLARKYSSTIPSIIQFWHWCKKIPYRDQTTGGNNKWNFKSRYR
jgi:hypothetical protein